VYTESADGLALTAKTVGADGKEASMHVAYKADGKSSCYRQPRCDSVTPKSVKCQDMGLYAHEGRGRSFGTVASGRLGGWQDTDGQ